MNWKNIRISIAGKKKGERCSVSCVKCGERRVADDIDNDRKAREATVKVFAGEYYCRNK